MQNSVGLINGSVKHGQIHGGVEWGPHHLKEMGVTAELYQHFQQVQNYFIRKNKDFCYRDLHKVTQESIERHDFSLILGGDHSLSLSTIPAILQKHPDLKIIWIDAHADMNTPRTSPSGNIHGMPLAALSGLFSARELGEDFQWIQKWVRPENIFLLGLRDVDAGEKDFLAQYPFQFYSYEQCQERGLLAILREIRQQIGDSPTHISFDIDSVDPLLAPATGVPVSEGFTFKEILQISSHLSQLAVVSLEMVEFNPHLCTPEETENTAEILLNFLRSFLQHRRRQLWVPEKVVHF